MSIKDMQKMLKQQATLMSTLIEKAQATEKDIVPAVTHEHNTRSSEKHKKQKRSK